MQQPNIRYERTYVDFDLLLKQLKFSCEELRSTHLQHQIINATATANGITHTRRHVERWRLSSPSIKDARARIAVVLTNLCAFVNGGVRRARSLAAVEKQVVRR